MVVEGNKYHNQKCHLLYIVKRYCDITVSDVYKLDCSTDYKYCFVSGTIEDTWYVYWEYLYPSVGWKPLSSIHLHVKNKWRLELQPLGLTISPLFQDTNRFGFWMFWLKTGIHGWLLSSSQGPTKRAIGNLKCLFAKIFQVRKDGNGCDTTF